MSERKMNQGGNQPGKSNPQQDRESASRRPGERLPDDQPNERASTPDRDEHDEAARRQARQDPLQTRAR